MISALRPFTDGRIFTGELKIYQSCGAPKVQIIRKPGDAISRFWMQREHYMQGSPNFSKLIFKSPFKV